MPLGAPQERHQTILERFSSHTGIQGLSKHPNFAHLGPWERTIIKEIDLKQLKQRIRHASGRWPGEFLGPGDKKCDFGAPGGPGRLDFGILGTVERTYSLSAT